MCFVKSLQRSRCLATSSGVSYKEIALTDSASGFRTACCTALQQRADCRSKTRRTAGEASACIQKNDLFLPTPH